jgi:uncharacterized protein YjgD (DUF1641 family)
MGSEPGWSRSTSLSARCSIASVRFARDFALAGVSGISTHFLEENDMDSPDSNPASDGPSRTSEEPLEERMREMNERMARIEDKLDRLTGLLDTAPDLLATVGDVADTYAERAAERGADVDERLQAAGALFMRLTEPEVLETFQMLVDNHEDLRAALETVESLEGQAAMVVDTVDTYLMELEARGDGVDTRVEALGELAVTLTETEVLETFQIVAERHDELRSTVEMLDSMPDQIAMAVDVFDDFIMRATEHDVDVVELTEHFTEALRRFSNFVQSSEFEQLVESGVFDPKAVDIVGRLADSMATVSREESDTSGFFDMFRAMRREDVRRAIHFLIRFGEQFGESLDREDEEVAPPEAELTSDADRRQIPSSPGE